MGYVPVLKYFAEDCGYVSTPFGWDEERRFLLRCFLDACFFYLYLEPNTSNNSVRERSEAFSNMQKPFTDDYEPRNVIVHIMNSFPIIRRNDEKQNKGSFRTKETILNFYDEIDGLLRKNKPLQIDLF